MQWKSDAKAIRVSVIASLLGIASSGARVPPHGPPILASATTAFEHVSVIPMDRERVLPDQTVIVQNGRVTIVRPSASVAIPRGAVVVDGRGRFLIPGLADMHTHLYDTIGFASYLAYGVTTVANLNGYPEVVRWRDAQRAGTRLGPNIYTVGPSVNGNPPGNSTFVSVETPDEARHVVQEQVRAGYDMIKVYSTLSSDVYLALGDEARRRHIAVLGHIPEKVGADAMLRAGYQSNVAHGEELLTTVAHGNPDDTSRIAEMAGLIRRAGITVTPNLFAYVDYLRAISDLRGVLRDSEMPYASPALVSEKLPAHNRSVRSDPERFATYLRRGHVWIAKMTRALSDSSVPLLLGTDTEVFGFPGESAIDELRELSAAGLTPYQALAAATSAPGDYIHRFVHPSERFGHVVAGDRADLLLLSANPLLDIGNVRRLDGVMVRGRWLPASAIAAMRDSVNHLTDAARRETMALDSLAWAGKVNEAVTRFRRLRRERPGVLPLAEVVLEEDAEHLFDTQPRDALALLTLNVESYPTSFSALSTRARAELALGDTAAARRDVAASLRLEPWSALTRAIDERLRSSESPTFSPVGRYELANADNATAPTAMHGATGPPQAWHATLLIADSAGLRRGTLDVNGKSFALAEVAASGDHLWASTGAYPNELPQLRLVVRGDSVRGRLIGGFGSNRVVAGHKLN